MLQLNSLNFNGVLYFAAANVNTGIHNSVHRLIEYWNIFLQLLHWVKYSLLWEVLYRYTIINPFTLHIRFSDTLSLVKKVLELWEICFVYVAFMGIELSLHRISLLSNTFKYVTVFCLLHIFMNQITLARFSYFLCKMLTFQNPKQH